MKTKNKNKIKKKKVGIKMKEMKEMTGMENADELKEFGVINVIPGVDGDFLVFEDGSYKFVC